MSPLEPVTGLSRAAMHAALFGDADRFKADATIADRGRATFDWYAASIDAQPTDIAEALASWLDASWRPAKGMHGYSAGAEIVRAGNVVARMIYGGNDDAWPHVWASGEDTMPFVAAVRALWPRHRVTRVDSALDFQVGDPWSELYDLAIHVADHSPSGELRARPLKLDQWGDWLREGSPSGRTLYVGSFKSPVFARLYEKGKQMRQAFPDQAEKYPLGWVRLELQVQPEKDARYSMATATPDEVWGASRWSKQLHSAVFGSNLPFVPRQTVRPPDDARSWAFFVKQYGPMLSRRVDVMAEKDDRPVLELWAQLGVEIGRAILAGEESVERAVQPTPKQIRKLVKKRRKIPNDAPWEGERIDAETRPDVRINVHERARIAADLGRARAEADAAYRTGPEDL